MQMQIYLYFFLILFFSERLWTDIKEKENHKQYKLFKYVPDIIRKRQFFNKSIAFLYSWII